MIKKVWITILASMLLPVWALGAKKVASAQADPAEQDFNFGLKLFQEQDYYRAITEFERCRFKSPEGPRSEEALRRIAISYYRGGRWKGAEKNLRDYLKLYPKAGFAEAAEFYLGESFFQQVQYPEARERFRVFTQTRPVSPMVNLALTRLAGLELAEKRWMEAGTAFDKLEASPLKDGYQGHAAAWARASRDGAGLGHKSLSGALLASAVIPGSGQAYAGYRGDGLVSFTLVAALGGSSAWLYSQNQNAPASALAVLGVVFYLANLQGTVNAVGRANEEAPRRQMEKIYQEIREVPAPEPEALFPLIKLTFH
jgi:tetratricopeptide (TPR) repeat protein